MKKFLLVLSLCMAVSVLPGCGSDNKTAESNASTTSSSITKRQRKSVDNTEKNDNSSSDDSTSSTDSAKESEVWIYSDNQKEDYPTVLGAYEFAKIVKESTNNRITVEVHANGELGDENDVVPKVQSGEIALMRVSLAPLANYSPELNILQLPYLYRDSTHMWKVLNGDVGEQFLKNLADTAQVMGLAWFDSGARNFYTIDKEIKSPADLAGLKIRVQENDVAIDMAKALGAEPVAMGYADVLTAFQNKTIDGAENSWPSYESMEHYKYAKYYTLDEHTRVPEMIIMNADLYNSLSTDEKDKIKEAALLASEVQREEWEKKEKASEEIVKAAGSVVVSVSDITEFQNAVQPLYEKYAADNMDLIKEIQEEY